MKLLVTVMIVALVWAPAGAAEVERVEVDYSRGTYSVLITAVLSAPIERVYEVLTDYPHWPRINDLIKESVVEDDAGSGEPVVYTVMGGCVVFFCKHFENVQRMRTEAPGRIDADVIPERSELEFGWARTLLTRANDTETRFHYEMELAPEFWIPPLIGPALVQHKLRKQAIETAEIVERIAAGKP